MIDPHNTFRPVDAMEYVDAYRVCVQEPVYLIRERIRLLATRMGETPTSGMLAAYRGYEDALTFKETGTLPGVVKLDDTDPTPCERMTPAGYRH